MGYGLARTPRSAQGKTAGVPKVQNRDVHTENRVDDSGRYWPGPSAEAVATTWGLMGAGHVLAVIVASVGLVLDDREGQLADAIRAALVFNLALGSAGAWLCLRMLRATLRAGRKEGEAARQPAPILECSIFVLVAVCLVTVAVSLWGLTPPLLLVAAELAFIPLALRTEAVFRSASPPDPAA